VPALLARDCIVEILFVPKKEQVQSGKRLVPKRVSGLAHKIQWSKGLALCPRCWRETASSKLSSCLQGKQTKIGSGRTNKQHENKCV